MAPPTSSHLSLSLRPLALQMSINRLQLLFWLIVLDADVWKQTRRWKLKLVFETTRAFKWTEGSIGRLCVSVQRTPPSPMPDTPSWIPTTLPQTCRRLEGWGEGGEGVPRGLYSLVTAKRLPLPEGRHGNAIWFLQQCQSTTPPILLLFWATHTHTHTHIYKRSLCDWKIALGITAKWP